MKFILLILIFFTSCEATNIHNEKILTRWISLQKIVKINPKIEQKKPIIKPKATIQYLFAVAFYDRSFELNYDCIYYEIPLNDEMGKLLIQKNYSDEICPDYPTKEIIYESLNVKDLNFELKEQNMFLSLQYKDDKEKNQEMIFRKMPLKISSSVSEVFSKKPAILKDNEICEKVSDDCKVTNPRCDNCKNSFFPIINSACKTNYSKVCGPNNCGTKGNPACIRGYAASKYDLDYCINDSPIGFCEGDLRVMCINNTLICD